MSLKHGGKICSCYFVPPLSDRLAMIANSAAKSLRKHAALCGGREEKEEEEEVAASSRVVLQSGTLAVWNAGRGQSRWELSAAVLEAVSRLPVPPTTAAAATNSSSTPLSRLQAQKRGAILRDQNEAGTDNLV